MSEQDELAVVREWLKENDPTPINEASGRLLLRAFRHIADLRETIGGVEQQVHEIRNGAKESFVTVVQDREIARLREDLSKMRTSVIYLRGMLCRIAADDYRGGEPEYIRLAREALRAEAEA